jgi:predicted DsbA family dithiol-disulfide isomerase
VHFPLHPETPAEGLPLEELFRGRNVDIKAAHTRLQALMDAEGLPYRPRTHTYNSRLAQEVAKWAETKPGGENVHDALFKAYFVEGLNIGDSAVLMDVARSVGLPRRRGRGGTQGKAIQNGCRWRLGEITRVRRDWRPTFVSGGRGVVGAQPYEVLVQLVSQRNTASRTDRDVE